MTCRPQQRRVTASPTRLSLQARVKASTRAVRVAKLLVQTLHQKAFMFVWGVMQRIAPFALTTTSQAATKHLQVVAVPRDDMSVFVEDALKPMHFTTHMAVTCQKLQR